MLSQARLVGDFDIQVGYRRLAGFETPPAGSAGSFPQLNVALGLWWNESRFIQFSRSRRQDGEWLSVYASLPELAATPMPQAEASAEAGTLRIVRTGSRLRFMHATDGASWRDLGAIDGPSTPVFAYLGDGQRRHRTAPMSVSLPSS